VRTYISFNLPTLSSALALYGSGPGG